MPAVKDFDYRNKKAPKLNDDFKQFFSVNIKGKNAIKAEGLTALSHEKGMWKCEVEILQYPNDSNNWTCICKGTIGGYDWDPIEQKVVRVEYTDIGDANVNNVGNMVKPSYIRMAATRAISRAMRKYTNVDMVSTDELDTVIEESMVTIDQLNQIKMAIKEKKMTQSVFQDIMNKNFGHCNFQMLSEHQGDMLISVIRNYIAPSNSHESEEAGEEEEE